MSTDVQAATCPARLLKVGDRILLGGTAFDLTCVEPLPGRVEVSFMAVEHESWAYSTDVFDPDFEVPLIQTTAQKETPL